MVHDARGQATVELVALLPVLALLAAGLWQVASTAHTIASAGAAARAASRAAAVGADPAAAARPLLPERLRDDAWVEERDGGAVAVSVPLRVPATGARLATYTATARFEPQR
jgi:hypothetical protein